MSINQQIKATPQEAIGYFMDQLSDITGLAVDQAEYIALAILALRAQIEGGKDEH